MANNTPSSGAQFPPVVPTQQAQPFIPMASQQFRAVVPGMPPNVGLPPGQSQPLQFSQPVQQVPPWPSQPGHATPSSMVVPMPYGQPNRPLTYGTSQLPQTAPPLSNHASGAGAPGVPLTSPYSFVASSFGQPQNNAPASHFQPMSQMPAPVVPVAGQPWLSSGGHSGSLVMPVQQSGQQSSTTSSDPAVNAPNLTQPSSSDWQEHTASDGRRYYYNKRTKQSSWEKPFELMTPIERADASTVWKEFTTPEGKKYYYNKVTKQSKWSMPEELKLAREQAQQTVSQGIQSEIDVLSDAPAATSVTSGETSSVAISVSSVSSSMVSGLPSSPIPVTPVVAVANPPVVVSASSAIPVSHSSMASDGGATPLPAVGSVSAGVSAGSVDAKTVSLSGLDNLASQSAANSVDGAFVQDTEEVKKGMVVDGKVNAASLDEKAPDDEPLVFSNKLEAKNAFKALLESANVQSDWTWEQAMKEIINDKRYGALKTPGERKQAFNEYLGQRKKLEAEEKRMRQKKAREEFAKMLEESKELTSSMKWSKAVSLFENDERFKAVERVRDREDLFDNYILELQRKEKEKAVEDHRRNLADFKKFLESCDFIKVNTQWKRIQDRLEDDERCLRLEKLDRLLVFQDYIRDLEREEEEHKKLHKEHLRRAERKNRDAFRKLLEEHVSAGILTAKTHWLDYCLKVKDLPPYHAIATNTSGSKPKDLFEDVAEELEKQYRDDKTRVKDAIKLKNIVILSTWTFEDFKGSVADAVGSPSISDINLKLFYEELVERAKEKEEKEAKKLQRLTDDFTELLYTYKEITAASSWEECKPLFEESKQYRSIAEEDLARGIFGEYVARLQEKAQEKERKREEEKAKKEKEREEKEKRKEKEKKEREKERGREKGKERTREDDTDNENVDTTDTQSRKEDRKREKEKDRKHRKRHQSATDNVSSDKDDKEESKKSRKHGSDRKKSKKHSYTSESEGESRHKRHKKEHRDGSRKNTGDELEDGEVGEDGEIR